MAAAAPASPWERSPVPAEHQIRGLGPIVLNVHDLARTERVLTEVMNMRSERHYAAPDTTGEVHVFAMGEGGPAAELHVMEQIGFADGAAGRGRRASRRVSHARRCGNITRGRSG